MEIDDLLENLDLETEKHKPRPDELKAILLHRDFTWKHRQLPTTFKDHVRMHSRTIMGNNLTCGQYAKLQERLNLIGLTIECDECKKCKNLTIESTNIQVVPDIAGKDFAGLQMLQTQINNLSNEIRKWDIHT